MATCPECGACVARARMPDPLQGFGPEFGDELDAGPRCPTCGAALPGEGATCNACALRDRLAERDRGRALLQVARAEAEVRSEQAIGDRAQDVVPSSVYLTWAVVGLLGGIVAVVAGVLWAIVKDDPQRRKLGWWTAAWGAAWVVAAVVVYPSVVATWGIGAQPASQPVSQLLPGRSVHPFSKVEQGMATDQVRALLGEPTNKDFVSGGGYVPDMETWYYPNGTLIFDGGRLTSKFSSPMN